MGSVARDAYVEERMKVVASIVPRNTAVRKAIAEDPFSGEKVESLKIHLV